MAKDLRVFNRDRATMKEPIVHLPVESRGEAGARGRLPGRRVLVVGGGQEGIARHLEFPVVF
jgi:hypothetical protein